MDNLTAKPQKSPSESGYRCFTKSVREKRVYLGIDKPKKSLSDYIRFNKLITERNAFLGVDLFGFSITLILTRR